MINSQGASYLIDITITAVAYETMYRQPTMWPLLGTTRPGSGSQDIVGSISSLDLFEESDDGIEPDDDDVSNLYAKTFVHRERKKSVRVSKNIIDDNRFNFLAQLGEQMGDAYYLTLELHLASIFHDAFAGSIHKSEDNVAICGAHTYGVTAAQNNGSITSALEYESFKAVSTAMGQWKNSRGLPERTNADTLVVPTAKQEDGWQILGQQLGRPDTASRAGNYYASGSGGTKKLIVWDLLDTGASAGGTTGSATRWYVLDLAKFQRNLHLLMRSPLEIYGEAKMFGTRRVGGYARYSYGVLNPFGIYGVNASA